jgi:hypothetical protein
MMKADDALSRGDGGWGGPREKSWEENGKRAVVMVDAGVYSLVTMLAGFCRRPVKSMNAQIYAAGLEALFGESLDTLQGKEVSVTRPKPGLPKPTTHDDVLTLAQKSFYFEGTE